MKNNLVQIFSIILSWISYLHLVECQGRIMRYYFVLFIKILLLLKYLCKFTVVIPVRKPLMEKIFYYIGLR